MALKSGISLSIIIAVGNYSLHLSNFLHSINNFQESNFEFIFVIDTLDTLDELSPYFKKFQGKYRLIMGNFGNPGSARNAGLKISTGDWIAFHDVDDVPQLTNLQLMIEDCVRGNFEIGCGTFETLDFKKSIQLEKFTWTSRPILDVTSRPGIWRMVFNRAVIGDIVFLERSMGEDQHFLMNIRFAERRIHFSPLNVYSYQLNVPNQLTSQKDRIKELKIVFDLEVQFINSMVPLHTKGFNSLLMLRQMATMLKNGIIPNADIKLIFSLIKWSAMCFMLRMDQK